MFSRGLLQLCFRIVHYFHILSECDFRLSFLPVNFGATFWWHKLLDRIFAKCVLRTKRMTNVSVYIYITINVYIYMTLICVCVSPLCGVGNKELEFKS